MTAPGNSVRQANYLTTPTAAEAVLLSFKYAAQLAAYWTRIPVWGVLLLLAVLMHRAAAVSRFSFRLPGLVTAWFVCLYAAMLCPPIYAMGNYGDARLLNIVFFAYLLLFALNIFYWQGYFAASAAKSSPSAREKALPRSASRAYSRRHAYMRAQLPFGGSRRSAAHVRERALLPAFRGVNGVLRMCRDALRAAE